MLYKDLDVYQRAYRLALELHKLSQTLPKELQYDLADQIRRASRSIPSNIAEGFGKQNSKKELINFLRISLGSNDETLFNLDFLKDSGLIATQKYQYFFDEYTICGKQLNRLISSLLANSNI